MNCPHCHEPLPEDNNSPWCPSCGKDWETAPGSGVARKFPWLLFYLVMAAPAMVDLLLVMVPSTSSSRLGPVLLVTFAGSAVSGIVCGIILARHKGSGDVTLVILQAAGYSILMAIVSFFLCWLGCALQGLFYRA